MLNRILVYINQIILWLKTNHIDNVFSFEILKLKKVNDFSHRQCYFRTVTTINCIQSETNFLLIVSFMVTSISEMI